MADFPLVKWVQVDGRSIPFAYPQHKIGIDNYVETGEENPLPTKDEAVKTELEAIKGTQSEIISALQSTNENLLATNEHLNSVIKDDRLQSDTQLTGSKVEISRSTVTVTQGSSYDIGTWEMPGFKEFYVSVTADTKHDYDLRQTQLHDTEGSNQRSLFVNDVIESGSSIVKYTEKPYLLIGRYLRVNIINNSSEDKIYDVRVWGIV